MWGRVRTWILAIVCSGCATPQSAGWVAADAAAATARQHRSPARPELVADPPAEHDAEPPPVVVKRNAIDPDALPGPTSRDLARAHGVALELAQAASRDARSGHCEEVVHASGYIARIDRDVYARVFLGDAGVRACLGITDF
jgi:hypothetical protein